MNRFNTHHVLSLLIWVLSLSILPHHAFSQIIEAESDQNDPPAQTLIPLDDDDIPLPEWSSEDLKRYPAQTRIPPPLGGGLWPIELYPLPPEPEVALSEMSAAIDLAQEESAASEMSTSPRNTQKMAEDGILSGGTRNADGQTLTIPDIPLPEVVPPPEKPSVLLAHDQMEHLLELRNLQFAADPRRLFSERDLNDLRSGLATHSRETNVQMKLLILDSHERISVDWSPDLGKSSFYPSWLDMPLDGNACLIVYSLGKPQLARIYFFGSVLGEISPSEIAHVENRSRAQAEVATVHIDQLAHFLTQLAAEIFWIQQDHLLKTEKITPRNAPPALPNESSNWVRWSVISSVMTGMIFGLLIPKYLQKKRRPFYFPILPCQKRFGGSVSGGGHVWISFHQNDSKS